MEDTYMCKLKKTINARLNFEWDDEDDLFEFKLIVPKSTTIETINEVIIKAHNFLCSEEDTEERYEKEGRIPATLLNYICEKNNDWEWEDFFYEVDLNLS